MGDPLTLAIEDTISNTPATNETPSHEPQNDHDITPMLALNDRHHTFGHTPTINRLYAALITAPSWLLTKDELTTHYNVMFNMHGQTTD